MVILEVVDDELLEIILPTILLDEVVHLDNEIIDEIHIEL